MAINQLPEGVSCGLPLAARASWLAIEASHGEASSHISLHQGALPPLRQGYDKRKSRTV